MNDLAIGYTFRPLIPGSRPFISTDVGSITEYFVIVNAFLTVAYTRKLLIHFVSNFGVHPKVMLSNLKFHKHLPINSYPVQQLIHNTFDTYSIFDSQSALGNIDLNQILYIEMYSPKTKNI